MGLITSGISLVTRYVNTGLHEYITCLQLLQKQFTSFDFGTAIMIFLLAFAGGSQSDQEKPSMSDWDRVGTAGYLQRSEK